MMKAIADAFSPSSIAGKRAIVSRGVLRQTERIKKTNCRRWDCGRPNPIVIGLEFGIGAWHPEHYQIIGTSNSFSTGSFDTRDIPSTNDWAANILSNESRCVAFKEPAVIACFEVIANSTARNT